MNFKNYPQAELELSPRVNCFAGNNGSGKTNLLDAIHYLSFCKSFLNAIDSQNILGNEAFFVVQGSFANGEGTDEVFCSQKRNVKKSFKKNKKEYARLADHIGLFPAVIISPADGELVTGGSEERRRFIDSVISQYDKQYLDFLIKYNQVLSQRNALLKQIAEGKAFPEEELQAWDVRLIGLGEYIFEKRKEFIDGFLPSFKMYFRYISGPKEEASLAYNSQLFKGKFEKLLDAAFKRDVALEFTSVGIHKDDLEFQVNGFPAKKFGSQGQQKSFLIALKLAEFDFIKRIKGVTPLLLLDDIYDKLDESRVKKLMELISGSNFGQIFITDTHEERIKKLFKEIDTEFRLFRITNGTIQ